MRIGCDIDGVIANWNDAFIPRVIQLTGRNLFGAGYVPTVWEYPTAAGYTREELLKVLDDVEHDAFFWRNLECYHGEQVIQALDTLNLRQARGKDDIYFITNRKGVFAKWQTERWLKSHGMSDPTVLLTKNKGLACAALELDAYIDDNLDNVKDVVIQCSILCQPFLCDRPWNQTPRDFIDEAEIPVVKSLWEMLQQLHMV